ncbi:MAG: branched-chain amino acid ABC transporter permease [Allorhizobium sp.]
MKRLVIVATALILIAMLPQILPPFYIRVVQLFFFAAALALAWNITGGFAGYWSFGHTAFIGVGAFSAAHVVSGLGLSAGPMQMMVGIASGALVCALFAAIIAYPILRLRGIYFAIAMLGVSQVAGELANNVGWVQGDVGIFIETKLPENMAPERFYFYLFGVLLVSTALIAWLVQRSRFGYGLLAIREDEDTAKMLGVPTERLKAVSFVISAALVGTLGATYAYSLGYFTAGSVFRGDFSLNMIIYCMIGGIGTIAGPIVGAAAMLFLTQIVLGQMLELHLLVTGLVVIAIVLTMPEGITGLIRSLQRRKHSIPSPKEAGQ